MKKSKYRAVKTEYDGVTYDSKKECAHGINLIIKQKLGLISDLERQVVFEWTEIHTKDSFPVAAISYKRKYICDFVYHDIEKGEMMYVDVKGVRLPTYIKKKKIVEHLFGIIITEV